MSDSNAPGLMDMLQQRLAKAALDHGAPAALRYLEQARPVAGLAPAEHLAGEVAGLGELPTDSPQAVAHAGFGGYSALPSGQAAYDLVHGDFRALPGVLFYTTMRAALIGAGLYAAGMREKKDLFKYSFAGAGVMELWVLWWAATRRPPGR